MSISNSYKTRYFDRALHATPSSAFFEDRLVAAGGYRSFEIVPPQTGKSFLTWIGRVIFLLTLFCLIRVGRFI